MSTQHIRMVDAAKELGISRQLLLYWIKENKIKHEIVLGVRVLTRTELDRYKQANKKAKKRS